MVADADASEGAGAPEDAGVPEGVGGISGREGRAYGSGAAGTAGAVAARCTGGTAGEACRAGPGCGVWCGGVPVGAGEVVVARPDRRTSRRSTPPAAVARGARAGSPGPPLPVDPERRVAAPGAGSVKEVPPPWAGDVAAERWSGAPGAAPEGAGCRVLGRAPVSPAAGPGRGTSRRQVAATTGRAVLPPAAAVVGGAGNPSAEPVFTVRARLGSRGRDRWTVGDSDGDGDGAAPPEPCAAARSRAIGRTRTGGGGVAEAGPVRVPAGAEAEAEAEAWAGPGAAAR